MTLDEIEAFCTGIHAKVSADVWPTGATLRCKRCDKQELASSEQCGRYLATGWPKHCGQTMELVSAKHA